MEGWVKAVWEHASYFGYTVMLDYPIELLPWERDCYLVDIFLESGKTGYNYTGRKIFNLWESSELARECFFRNPELTNLLSFLLGRRVIPFQSLNFTRGSEQRAHSDAIHMTTQPQGFLIATWIALEDIDEGSGPLAYYPGSHRLPFVSTEDYNSGNGTFTIGSDSNRHYEDKIEEIIAQKGLEKRVFLANRGDVLIWHSNLLHAGTRITREESVAAGSAPNSRTMPRMSDSCWKSSRQRAPKRR
jgi:hypothetical protein